MDFSELEESKHVYKPIFDRGFFCLIAKKMCWENPDKLYDNGLTGQQLSQLLESLRHMQDAVKDTVEWTTFRQSKGNTLAFCSMRTDELKSLFYCDDHPKGSVRIYLLNRLARFVSSEIRQTNDKGAAGVYRPFKHLYGLKGYDQIYRELGGINVSLKAMAQKQEPQFRSHSGSGLMENGSVSIIPSNCKPGDSVVATYRKNNEKKWVKLIKQKDESWQIVSDSSTTHADADAFWHFPHLTEGERFTMEKVGSGEAYTYDCIERIQLLKNSTNQIDTAHLNGLSNQDYLTNLHAGGFFINDFGEFLSHTYSLHLASLEDFRSLEMLLKQSEDRVQEMKKKFGAIFPFQPGEFCQLNNEELRNLFGYNGLAYFEHGVRIYGPKSSEKPVKINLVKLDKLSRFMTFESSCPDREALEACCNDQRKPYKGYIDLEQEYAHKILTQGHYQVHGGGSGVDLSHRGLLAHIVPVGTTVVFSYVQGFDKDQRAIRNQVSLYYNGDCCWKVVNKGNPPSNIDEQRVWRTAAIFNGEPLRLMTFEGDMEYCFGYLGGGVRIERGSNRAREGLSSISQFNVLKMGKMMGSQVKTPPKKS